MRVFAECGHCGNVLIRKHIAKSGRYFCGVICKALWQQTQKPVTKEWLIQKYVNEEMNCTQIAKIVQRDAKSVWAWLKGYGIETRKRGFASSDTWMKTGGTSLFAGRRHTAETRRRLREIALRDGRVPFDKAVGPPLKGKKGKDVHTWRGGVTPERQAFYSTSEWKAAVRDVWTRDNATCQKCGRKKQDDRSVEFDIHHIVSFSVATLRAEIANLVLLCEPCHYWVHSSENTQKLFITGDA